MMSPKLTVFLALLLSLPSLSQPTIEWQMSFGGSAQDRAHTVRQTEDGGYIVGGVAASFDGDVIGNHGGFDQWILKLSSNGTIEWQRSLGGSNTDFAFSLEQTTDGGYIIAGGSRSSNGDVSANQGELDLWIVKLSSTGNTQWQTAIGGTQSEVAHSIQETSDGGYIVGGYSSSNNGDVSGNHGGSDCWIVKLTTTGVIEWQKSLGGNVFDVANSIEQTIDGGYIVAGSSASNDGDVSGNHGGEDYWIVKLTQFGVIEWQKAFGGSSLDRAFSIEQTQDEGYIVGGFSFSDDGDILETNGAGDYWILKLSSVGVIEWQKSLGGSAGDYAHSIQQTMDGGYIVAGSTESNDGDVLGNHGATDYWLVKLTEEGSIQWQKPLGGSELDIAEAIQESTDGGYIVAGYSESENGDVTINNGGRDYWVVKLGPVLGIEDDEKSAPVLLYPNPTHGNFTIENIQPTSKVEVRVIDISGKQIFSKTFSGKNKIEVFQKLEAGIYFIQVSTGSKNTVLKLIIN